MTDTDHVKLYIARLDALDVDPLATGNVASRKLRRAGHPATTPTVSAAQRRRREARGITETERRRHVRNGTSTNLVLRADPRFADAPCVGKWREHDDHVDGETITERDHRYALATARCLFGCPVLELCATLTDELGATVTGVWAGKVYGHTRRTRAKAAA